MTKRCFIEDRPYRKSGIFRPGAGGVKMKENQGQGTPSRARTRTDSRLRRRWSTFHRSDRAAASNVGTILLVILTVAMVAIVGAYIMGMAQMDTTPPEVEVMVTSDMNSMHAHIKDVSDEVPLSEFRLIARHPDGSMILYDSDGDAVSDAALSHSLDLLTVDSAAGPQMTPLFYVDVDKDGYMSSGDFLTLRHPFFAPLAPFIDATHGYKMVMTAPSGIPRESKMLVVVSSKTLPGAVINPGDDVRVTIAKAGTTFYQTQGTAVVGGIYTTTIDIPAAWTPATYGQTEITVRPGEVDEVTIPYPIKVMPDNPVSPAEKAYWETVNNPVVDGTNLMLVHKPSNTIVLEFNT